MTHLTIDQLLALREPGSEPGAAAAQQHIQVCAVCAAEFDRLHQRVARLRALPTLRPARDQWPAVDARRRAVRRNRRLRWAGGAGLALAASLAGFAVVRPGGVDAAPTVPIVAGEIAVAKERSQALEAVLDVYNPETRMIDGHTARMAQVLEDRIAIVDRQLQVTDLSREVPGQNRQLLDLWRERVGLLDALVDVHVTRASNVGL